MKNLNVGSIKNLRLNAKLLQDLRLRKIALGEIQGSMTGYASIDKPWLKYYDEESICDRMHDMKIYDYLITTITDYNAVGIIYYGKKITYETIIKNIDNVAKSLISLGIKEGDVVTLSMPTTPETVYLFYALNRIGAIANMVDPRTNESRIRKFIKDSLSKYIFAIDVYEDKIRNAIDGTDIEFGIITSASTSLDGVKKIMYNVSTKLKSLGKKENKNLDSLKFLGWNQFINLGKKQKNVIDSKYKKNSAVGIVYTGGTTGVPKGAVLSNEDLVAQAKNMYHALNIQNHGRGCKFLNIMPPFIAYGLTCGLSSVLCMGMQVDIIPKFEPDKFDKLILKNKPEIILGVPSFFEKLMLSDNLKNADLSFLKVIIVGGDSLNTETEKKINGFLHQHNCNIKITKGYGMTEMCAVTTYTISDKCNSIGSVGIPLVHNNVMIVNPSTRQEVKYGEEGEIYLSGPTEMLMYLNNDEETNKVRNIINNQSWIKTGDIGRIENNGEIFVLDRLKRMIIRPDGHNVFPSQIENVIAKHDAVKQVAVVGISHAENENGQIPTAFIILKDTIQKNEVERVIEEIEQISKANLPERDKALEYYVVDSLPYTSIGKVDFQKIEETETKRINALSESKPKIKLYK